MKRGRWIKAILLGVALLLAREARADVFGDVNGDGRLSFADAWMLKQWLNLGLDPATAPGIAGAVEKFPCSYWGGNPGLPSRYDGWNVVAIIFQESLRRLSPSPLPLFREAWPEAAGPAPAPPDPDGSLQLEMLDVTHDSGTSQVELKVKVTTFVPIDALCVIVRVEGVDLRPPPLRGCDGPGGLCPSSPSILSTAPQYYLLSGGAFLAYHSDPYFQLGLGPSETTISLFATLPKGLAPGSYPIQILGGTEAVAEGGAVVTADTAPGALTVTRRIEDGSDLPFPPLVITEAPARKISGTMELGVDSTGAEGKPGDEVTVSVRVRAGRPVNRFSFGLYFPKNTLKIVGAKPLHSGVGSDYAFINPNITAWYYSGIGAGDAYTIGLNYSPNIEYLAPLSEWVDILEVRFRILEGATGMGEIPLRLDTSEKIKSADPPLFEPYLSENHFYSKPCLGSGSGWEFEPTVYHQGSVRVLGDGVPVEIPPPVDPAVAGIRFGLGEASGVAGDLVRVPIDMTSSIDLYQLRIALAFDASRLDLEGIEVTAIDADGNPAVLAMDTAGMGNTTEVCKGDRSHLECHAGRPWIVLWRGAASADEVPAGSLVLDLIADVKGLPGDPPRVWEADVPHSIGALLLRIRPDAPPGRSAVGGASATWLPHDGAGPIAMATYGYPTTVPIDAPRLDVPALEVAAGGVFVLSDRTPFLRGDSNGDGRVDLSDSVASLLFLFLGGATPGCLDAVDADDSGAVEITDPIYILDALFQGGKGVPAPYPDCGTDGTDDGIGCQKGCQ